MGRALVPGKDKISEAWVKDKIKGILKEAGVQYFMPMGGQFGRAGAADFICCHNGRYYAIEAKAGKNTQSPPQKHFQMKIIGAGGQYLLINEHNYETLRTFFN